MQGKTLQTISLLGWAHGALGESGGGFGPHVILVPKSTLANWCVCAARRESPHFTAGCRRCIRRLAFPSRAPALRRANECARWCPTLRVATLAGPKEERATFIEEQMLPGQSAAQRGWHVLITTYECAVLEKSALAKVPWQVSITRHLPLLALQQHPCQYLPVHKFYLPRSTS